MNSSYRVFAVPQLARLPSSNFDLESLLRTPPRVEDSHSLVVPFEAYADSALSESSQSEGAPVGVPPLAPIPSFPSSSRAPSFSFFDASAFTGMAMHQ